MISPKQFDRIKELSALGYSSTDIQRQLGREGLGLRRTVLLGYIREAKGRPIRPETAKYTPLKYLTPKEYRGGGNHIAVYGAVDGEPRRIQTWGSPKDLYQAMIKASRMPPKKRFLTVHARELGDDPERFLSFVEEWDDRTEIES